MDSSSFTDSPSDLTIMGDVCVGGLGGVKNKIIKSEKGRGQC